MALFNNVVFRYAFLLNQWLWFHIGAGVFIYLQLHIRGVQEPLVWLLGVAILWEVIEFLWKTLRGTMDTSYGDKVVTPIQHFILDALGDVSIPLAVAFIIELHILG